MPDADGRIRGITVPAEAWERIFGNREPEPHRCHFAMRLLPGGLGVEYVCACGRRAGT